MAGAQSTITPQPSQVDLSDVKGAVVTLYHFDEATGGKGAMVPLPDGQNPQEVQWDYTKAAPGTYTFYKVPQGTYYVEAVHGNATYFAIVTVDQGTSTANVAIPPYNDSGFYATPSPEATLSSSPSPLISPPATEPATLTPTPGTTPSPGMTTLCALTGLMLVALYIIGKRE
ncbi:MAG TPA: hypothetical protein VGJ92_04445 [Methanocella sp.]